MARSPFIGQRDSLANSPQKRVPTLAEVGGVTDDHFEAVHLCRGRKGGRLQSPLTSHAMSE